MQLPTWLQSPTYRLKHAFEKRGKLLVYYKLDPNQQKPLDAARTKEWGNYISLGAANIISREEADRLVSHGAEELPSSGSNETRTSSDVRKANTSNLT